MEGCGDHDGWKVMVVVIEVVTEVGVDKAVAAVMYVVITVVVLFLLLLLLLVVSDVR